MGTQTSYGVGYGFLVTPKAEKALQVTIEDLWDEIEDNYPLLEYSISGNHYYKAEASVISIKSLTSSNDGFGVTRVTKKIQAKPTAEETAQLMDILQRAGLKESDLGWFSWVYQG